MSYQQASKLTRPPSPASTIRFCGCISTLSHRSRVLAINEQARRAQVLTVVFFFFLISLDCCRHPESEVDPFLKHLALNLLGNCWWWWYSQSHLFPLSPHFLLVPLATSMDLRGSRTTEERDIFCKVISREEITFIAIVLIADMTNTLHYSEGDRHTDHTAYVLKDSTVCRAPIEDTT